MERRQGISKSVLVLVTAGIALSLFLIWKGLSRNESPPAAEASAAVAPENSPPEGTASAEPAPVSPVVSEFVGELPPVIPISLAGVPVADSAWLKSGPFLALPRGTQSFGGIEFWLDGVIALHSQAAVSNSQTYESKIVLPLEDVGDQAKPGLHVGSNVASVHLVGATHFKGEGQVTVAELVWRYVDGSARRTVVGFQTHLRDWMRLPYETPALLPYPFTKVVWRGENPQQRGRLLRLYRFSFANPLPAKVVRQLEFTSAMAGPQLFVLGVTLDPLKPGERPDPSPNLELTDPSPPKELEVRVVNVDHQPISNVKVRAVIQQGKGKVPERLEPSAVTDQDGIAQIKYPPLPDLDRFELSVTPDEYESRKIVWLLGAGDKIPAKYTFKLASGVTMGGSIMDARENPISEARIWLYRGGRRVEEGDNKGEQSAFSSRRAITDAQGSWQIKAVPAETAHHVGLWLGHADFVSTNLNVEATDKLAELREGTFKTVLHSGPEVRGRVTDEFDVPILRASVWAANRNGQRQEKKTDAEGRFTIRSVAEGEAQFSVTAKGRKPEVRTLTVKAGMEEILFKLKRGQIIRALVRNEAGEPLPGTRATFQSSGESSGYQFGTITDGHGRFEWDGAPDEPSRFSFSKTGYEQKHGHQLKPNEDNVVTLRKSRQVQGWVLDAATQQPVTKFRVGVGFYNGPDNFYPNRGMKEYADANGTFTLELNDEQETGIKAESDDYAGKVEKLPEAQNGVIQVVLRLNASPALRGVLLSPEGAPVAGGSVALTSGQPGDIGVSLRNGRLSNRGSPGKVVTTDASGQFSLPSPPESGMVVGAAGMGFATAPIQQVRASGRLVLQAYGRIEGTFKIGGQPVSGQEFMLSLPDTGIYLEWDAYKTTTDEEGRFSFNKAPPGEGQIVRLLKTSPNSWSHSHSTSVVVEPGRTTQVTLGDSGAVLKGRVRFEAPPADAEKLTVSGGLRALMQRPPNIQSGDEAGALSKRMKYFGVSVKADGSFTLDSIPPGTYTLDLTATKPGVQPWEGAPVAQGHATVTVPDSASPFYPITLDEIVLKPAPQPKASQPFVR